MAYKLYKTGDQVRDDLDAVEEKTIYPDASVHEKGLMTKEHVQRLDEVDNKVDKVAGKGLSTNDYTNEDKQKVDSALQAETDPTVPQWAKQPNKPSYNAQEVGALPNSTKYGSTIDLAMDSATYVLTLSLKDQDGTVLNTKTVDLPIESVVVNGRYDATNKKIVLTLQSGSTIDVPVGDLIAGLQTEITSVNMLDADLVDDTNSTHKFVTLQEKQTWNNKSDFSGSYNDLSDKPTIPAAQIQSDWNQSDSSAKDFIKNKPTIPVVPTNVSAFTNDAGYLTQHQDVSDKVSVNSQTFTDAQKQQARNNIGAAGVNDVPTLPANLSYFSNDSGEGIIPSDGIRAVTVTSAAAMTINPDVVTVIDGAVGTSAITLQVPNDNLAHVWDILMTTDSSVAITLAMSNSETILYPDGFAVGASKNVEISVIGVGTKYYLRYGEFA